MPNHEVRQQFGGFKKNIKRKSKCTLYARTFQFLHQILSKILTFLLDFLMKWQTAEPRTSRPQFIGSKNRSKTASTQVVVSGTDLIIFNHILILQVTDFTSTPSILIGFIESQADIIAI